METFKHDLVSLIQINKRNGPRDDPCSTPEVKQYKIYLVYIIRLIFMGFPKTKSMLIRNKYS